MNSLIILTTTNHKYPLRAIVDARRAGKPLPDAYIRIILDAFDILRVVEVKNEDGRDHPICKVSYTFEDQIKECGETVITQVQHTDVRHSLDEIYEMMNNALREKQDWEQ